MPLHDWTVDSGWEGFHTLWITELLRWVKPRLPAGYRAYLGTTPTMAIGPARVERPDLHVRREPADDDAAAKTVESAESEQPEIEVAAATLDPQMAVFVERDGWLVSALELVSPRNKDRPEARDTYARRYISYLMNGVHLLLIDVHPRPRRFSFADRIAEDLAIPNHQPLPAPMGIAYRVGDRAPDRGRFLGMWRRPLTIGQPLPPIPLPIGLDAKVIVDLEPSYARSAADAYLA